MERDFLGLSSKERIMIVEDDNNSGKDDGGSSSNNNNNNNNENGNGNISSNKNNSMFRRGSSSGMQWPFANKVSAASHFAPAKSAQDERSKKISFEPIALSSLMPVSTTDAFDANQKAFRSASQKNMNLDRQGGIHYTTTTYPTQHVDAHRPTEVRSFPVSNHAISVSTTHPFFKSQLGAAGHNFSPAPSMQQPQQLGGILVKTSNSIFPNVSGSGISEQRNVSKTVAVARAPAQLTIFYGGQVNVYDDISPEKAQAIMFLAGNVVSPSQIPPTAIRAQVLAPTSKPNIVTDVAQGNQSMSPCSGISSPMSVTSHVSAQSGSGNGCTGTNELTVAKPIRSVPAPISQPEPSKAGQSSRGSAAAPLMPAAVPQARKASLARFLEKRKERITNAMPYNLGKQSPGAMFKAGSVDFSFSAHSGKGCTPVSKEQTLQSWTKDENNRENMQTTLEM